MQRHFTTHTGDTISRGRIDPSGFSPAAHRCSFGCGGEEPTSRALCAASIRRMVYLPQDCIQTMNQSELGSLDWSSPVGMR